MIDFYYWTTPNCHKITLFLEEATLPYKLIPINISKGEQFSREFLAISPNNKIPAIVDHDAADKGKPISVFESGTILLYLAEKTNRFLSQNKRERNETLQWLFWQVGGLGPMAGQNHHFSLHAPEIIPYAVNRYIRETSRLYAVLDRQLANKEYIVGTYSIADMACYPWVAMYEHQQQNINDFPNVKRWLASIQSKPAVIRAYAKANEINNDFSISEEAKRILFFQDANTIRSQCKAQLGQRDNTYDTPK